MGLISNGTTIFDNGSMASGFSDDLKFISKATASASASIEFTSGIDSTYKEYVFYFVNCHPSNSPVPFTVNFSSDGGSNYNVTKTSAGFQAYHREDGSASLLGYASSLDLAQDTGEQMIAGGSVVNNNDSGVSGSLQLFNPSSTTFVKHYMTIANSFDTSSPPYTQNQFSAGYCNTTSAVNAVRFKFGSGNIDAGEILLFGVN